MRTEMKRLSCTVVMLLALAGAAVAQEVGRAVATLEASVPSTGHHVLGTALYDQTDSPAGAALASQVFEPASSLFDCRAGDDFTVPVPDIQWDIGGLDVLGAYVGGPGPTPLVDVEFFGDGGGLPGASMCSYLALAAGTDFLDDGAGNLTITLPTPCSLTAGDYWVSVRADMDLATGGQWLWQMRSVQAGAEFAWENPPDGFGTGCVVWAPAGSCGASGADLLFALDGGAVPVELQSITIE